MIGFSERKIRYLTIDKKKSRNASFGPVHYLRNVADTQTGKISDLRVDPNRAHSRLFLNNSPFGTTRLYAVSAKAGPEGNPSD